ncbi:MAG TPA: response regulator, partial [Spirochaetota bacterium]|nr:response regulator [Spirochaetota bacterium]HPJ69213.1 response regulator [Desulfobacteraceae bacterium]
MSKILIIDDEPIVLKSCERIFKNEDIEIDTAVSGEEGIEKIDAGRFDIVITDLMMPGIGGMEVVKHI